MLSRALLIVLIPWISHVHAQGREMAKEALETPWQEMARLAGLSRGAIARLDQEKVVMTQEELRQPFEAYLPGYQRRSGAPDVPYFITTDALFQAYTWCLQKALTSIEVSNANALPEFLRVVLVSLESIDQRVEGDSALIQAAKRRAQFVIGVAASLMDVGIKNTIKDPSLRDDIEIEVLRIRLAEGTGLPKPLNLPADAFTNLDYIVFKPVSFYSNDAEIAAYFRAIRWLQVVPFRINADEDMLASQLLALSLRRKRLQNLKLDPAWADWLYDWQRTWENLAGPPDQHVIDINIATYEENANAPKYKAADLIRQSRPVGDNVREGPADVAITSTLAPNSEENASRYVLPGVRVMDAQWLELLSRENGRDYFPNALSIASRLGSSYAAEMEKGGEKADSLREEAREQLKSLPSSASLHARTLALLQRLFDTPPPDAPSFMKSRAWSIKSCQTALSAWAQARHVWALQVRPQYAVAAGVEDWPAFVEPNPDFFAGLGSLAHALGDSLARVKRTGPRPARIGHALRRMADACDPQLALEKLPIEDRGRRQEIQMTAIGWLIDSGAFDPGLEGIEAPETRAAIAKSLRENAEKIERNQLGDGDSAVTKLKERFMQQASIPLPQLETTCLRLALLAHKQMRGQKPLPEEYEWLRYFGMRLAIFSDSHFTAPMDDVPKAVRIFTNQWLNKALTVGIGRPCFLYVLYPWKGRDILCRGAVLPYLERHGIKPLTDAEWRSTLHHPEDPPIVPQWLQPLIAE
jgi:hypothetical protein